MPLFKGSESDQSIRSVDHSLPDHVIRAKKDLTPQQYTEYIEAELTDALMALHNATRFVSALDVAKTENVKIIKKK